MRRILIAVAVFALASRVLADGAGPAPAVRVGDTYQEVTTAKGKPDGEIAAGPVRVLKYPDAQIKVRDGVVIEVRLLAAAGAPGPVAAPAKPVRGPDGLYQIVLQKDAIGQEIDAFRNSVSALFLAGKYAELEAIASKVDRDKSLFGDGSWKAMHLQWAIDLNTKAPDEAWEAREAEIEAWQKAFPQSVSAHVAHIRFLTQYAWHARGSGWASTVNEKAWPTFENRLAQAYILCQAGEKAARASPLLFWACQKVALGQGWGVDEMTKALDLAKRAEPEFWEYDAQMCYFLLPRWYGKDGDWEDFVNRELRRKEGLGAEGYARTVFEMEGYYKNVFKETRVQWSIVQDGYRAMFAKYPDSRRLLCQYACLAVLAEDRASAQWAFDRMAGVADPSVWSTPEKADEFERWAYWHP